MSKATSASEIHREKQQKSSEVGLSHDTTLREVEHGETVHFSVGFDNEMLARLDPNDLLNEEAWEKELKAERLKAVLEVFARLPDRLNFQAGITAIFGENGAGKTLLADVVTMALEMEIVRQEGGIPFGVRMHGKEGRNRFIPHIPGRLQGAVGDYGSQQRTAHHNMLVAGIAECVRVYDATVFSKENKYDFAKAHRSPAALGDVALGMSSRQSIDFLRSIDSERQFQASDTPPSVIIYDEPEMGMSPRRQMTLVEELVGQASGAVELVPSNSIMLFESDLPRIDLEYPEKGIHAP